MTRVDCLHVTLIAACVVAAFGPNYIQESTPTAGDFIVLSHFDVNIRAGPGLDAVVIGRAQKGTLFPLLGAEGEWYEIVLSSGVPRYVNKSLAYHLTPDQIIPGHRLEPPASKDSTRALATAIAVETDRAAREAEELLPHGLDSERHETLRQLLVDRYLLDLFTEQGVQPAVYWLPDAEALRP